MIYTFYSFKGGVGRSMALANIAELLYARGLKVLMVDFDLEAPGLERYFNEPKTVTKPGAVLLKRGIIDLLVSYLELRALPRFEAESEAARPGDEFRYPVEPLKEFITPIYQKNTLGGELSLISAGQRSGEEFRFYAQRIRSFDWDDFYERWDGEAFFAWFRRAAEAEADVVLIDSRTGVSEMSGVCTYQLADVVVMFVAPNEQNLNGTVMMADSLLSPELIKQRGRPLSLLFIPSRVDYSEAALFDDFAKEFKKRLERRSPALRKLEGASFDDLKLIYIPNYAYMEKVAVREPERASAADLIKAYEKIATALAQLEPEDGPLRKSYYPSPVAKRARVFISYRRNVEPDKSVVRQLYDAVSQSHDVFIDKEIRVGVSWSSYIKEALEHADFLIAILSANSSQSEMMLDEIEYAHRLAKSRGGQPILLPVRLNYLEPLPYPLSAYLNHLGFAYWNGAEDTPRLIDEVLDAISNGKLSGKEQLAAGNQIPSYKSPLLVPPSSSAQSIRLQRDEGTMDPQSLFYVERPEDLLALEAIKGSGVTITIKGPYQMGKSSLLIRTVGVAERFDKRVAYIDFQLIDQKVLSDPELFFREFCGLVASELAMPDQIESYWSIPLGHTQKCTRFMERYILKGLSQPLVLAMDEVDVLFDTDFQSDFFGMLRSWHNNRARGSNWKQLDLVIVTSTEPYQLIENLNQSPFNVGEVLELADFTAERVADLNQRHGAPLQQSEVWRLMDLISGHPYLTRRALYLLASGALTTNELFTQAVSDTGPFGDHLRRHLFRLHGKKDQINGLLEVINKKTCRDVRVFFRLRGAGLVKEGEEQTVVPRCRLYGDYFKEHLNA